MIFLSVFSFFFSQFLFLSTFSCIVLLIALHHEFICVCGVFTFYFKFKFFVSCDCLHLEIVHKLSDERKRARE